jgi:hypothetical protein
MLKKHGIVCETTGSEGGGYSSRKTGQYTSTKRTNHKQHQGIAKNK